MNTDLMFSSRDIKWETPWKIFEPQDHEFGFDIDVCADERNAKCNLYITEKDDGLKTDWSDFAGKNNPVCWMNPPYGQEISKWLKKAYEESKKGCVVVCLLPARIDTKWWWDYCLKAFEIRFLKGRIKFDNKPYYDWLYEQEYLPGKNSKPKKNRLYKQYGKKDAAGFPSAIVVFNETRADDYPEVDHPLISWVDPRRYPVVKADL